jgi:hypothetical protein
VAVVLLLWNCWTAWYASPFTLLQSYDTPQYQLLARNRLHGHYEVGDSAHTVRREGCHPMWRPGLVWIEQGLGAWVGSVQTGAALASALGTTLMELGWLWLAWRCFGFGAWVVVLVLILSPWRLGSTLLASAVGQGPEPWAAAAVVIGLAVLFEAFRKRSLTLAPAAGIAAGMAEWFRSGTLVLFAAPCAVYGLTFLAGRRWGDFGRMGLAVAGLLLAALAAGWTAPSPVNKTWVNLEHNLNENEGPFHTEEIAGLGQVAYSMSGYRLVPGTNQVFNDFIVRKSRGVNTADYLADKADTLGPLYLDRLQNIMDGPALGLRWVLGLAVVLLFLFQVVLSLRFRNAESLHTLAQAAGALAYYLGPVALLRGDAPSHYLLLAVPFFGVVAAQGVVNLAAGAWAFARNHLPNLVESWNKRRGFALAVGFTLGAILNANFYGNTIMLLAEHRQQAAQEQEALDALHLEGKTVVCRNMSWFVDREIETVLLPYAKVAELGKYVRAQRADGILVWEAETQAHFRATPYRSFKVFDRALRRSPAFDPPQTSGAWRWYPVRREFFSTREP